MGMVNLEVLKKSRKFEKAAFTKVFNKVKVLVARCWHFWTGIRIGCYKIKGWSPVNNFEILEVLSETVFEIVENFLSKVIRIETKAKRVIYNKKTDRNVLNYIVVLL